MEKKRKVGFTTKILSNHYYVNEVPVEGKTTSKFNWKIGFYDQYVAQVIRTGNCVTLLSNRLLLSEDSFWNINYFEDLTRYVFWTFNKSFLLKITEKIQSLRLPVLQQSLKLLKENFVPYSSEDNDGDEELQFCYAKNANLKKDQKFARMYILDEQNRTAILMAVEKRINEFSTPSLPTSAKEAPVVEDDTKQISNTILFLDVLRPMNGSTEEALQFMTQKIEEAGFEYKLFVKTPRLENGKNRYGLNGSMAAMIDFFYQLNYFKKEYSLEEIFKAYLQFSGNRIGKFKTFISEFRYDNSFIKHSEKLKTLKINKLQ